MAANRCPNSSCEYFNRLLPNHAKICPLCGTALGDMIAAPVQPSLPLAPTRNGEQTNYQPRLPYPQPIPPSPPSPVPPVLKLVHTTGREFYLRREDGCIGRRSQIQGTVPEIDLVGIPDEGIVSRTHARVHWDWNQNTYMILDDHSRNGTYINGNLLSPGVNYRLSHGDSLQLGQDGLVRFTVVVA
ncbi:FHA domain-containing protein [Nostoc sp. XA010]|uniref:FHA domain-containing protein n=1 Tax=Nostoc sp. XA010 TaxID=2780407 RepID=UPI001E5D9087|nr:FHA domain-containing protein [Nostoc sp. XA010]MCC5659022.1 FHA domain-containing protein [Nostoc sp. XA010]